MIDTTHLLKVTAAWVSIVYVVCFAGVALYAPMRTGFMMYALHMKASGTFEGALTVTTFFSGLVIWNIVAALAVWLFAALYNGINK